MILLAQRRTAEQEILGCEREMAVYETLTELLPSRDLGVRRVALAEQEIWQWQEVVNRRRQQEAEQRIAAGRAGRPANCNRLRGKPGQAQPAVLLGLIKENAALAEARKSLAARIVEATGQLEQTTQKLGA